MAYILGCDVSMRKLDLSLIDSNGAELWTDQSPNNENNITEMLLSVLGAYPALTCVVEATNRYHVAFAETAYALGLTCLVFNPILAKQQIKTSIRGKKAYRTDALTIARLGLRGEGLPFIPELYPATKAYVRGRSRLSVLEGVARTLLQPSR